MRPHDCDMIGNVAGIGGARANVDQSNPAAPRFNQMKGRHLRHPFQRHAALRRIAKTRVACRHIAGLDEGITIWLTLSHPFPADPRKSVDVKLIVSEDNKILKMFGVGASVMVEPV